MQSVISKQHFFNMKNIFIIILLVFFAMSCDMSGGRNSGGSKTLSEDDKKAVKKHSGKVKNTQTEEELKATQEELKQLKKLLDARKSSFKVSKSTYKPVRAQQVQEYLKVMYEIEVEQLQKQGIPETVLDNDFKSFFTITYCDNRILKELDAIAERSNRTVGSSIQVKYELIKIDSLESGKLLKTRK